MTIPLEFSARLERLERLFYELEVDLLATAQRTEEILLKLLEEGRRPEGGQRLTHR